jgi:hypothetical protein
MTCSAQGLFEQLVPNTPGCPAWLHLEQRGIPTETIEAHQDELRYLEAANIAASCGLTVWVHKM